MAGEERYALVIGVDEYQDPRVNKLEAASLDAQAIAKALVDNAGFPADHVVLPASNQPPDRQPTRGAILRRLSNLRGLVPKDGLLLVSFAGPGIERDGRAYLLPADAQLNNDIDLLEDTAISLTSVRDRINQTGVQQVVVIVDACRNDPSSARGEADNRMTSAYTDSFDFNAGTRGLYR